MVIAVSHRPVGPLAACCLVGAVLSFLLGSSPGTSAQMAAAPQCRLDGAIARLPGLPEASGLAVSHRSTGRLWTHNDSGAPELVAIDTDGRLVARVPVLGAEVEDLEGVATGPCPASTCIFVADIGDNDAERPHGSIYRLAEPDGSAPPATLKGDVLARDTRTAPRTPRRCS